MRWLALILSLFIVSCGGGAVSTHDSAQVDTMRYARYISISHTPDYTDIEIKSAWDSTKLLHRYILVDRGQSNRANIPQNATLVEVPLQRVAVYGSVHTSIIEMLGQVGSIVGVCEVEYIDSQEVHKRISQGSVADLGNSMSPNIEKIIDSHTQAIITSPFKDTGYGAVEKLGIPIVEGADYVEPHPLGRVEWIKFYGLLFGQREMADSIFKHSEAEYMRLKSLASQVEHRPTVLAERRYGGSWFVPAGESYQATLFEDAGAEYIFASRPGRGSLSLSFEEVLEAGIDAQCWILKSTYDITYEELRREYEPYAHFGAFKNRRVYNCNTSESGYYQHTPMMPHHLLAEYIYMFHPELLPDFEPHYFSLIEDNSEPKKIKTNTL